MGFPGSIRSWLIVAALILCGQQAFAQAVWTGGASTTDWNAAGNWSGSMIPMAGSQVQIPTGLSIYPTINTNVGNLGSLTVSNGATLRVDPMGVITVANAVSIAGTLRVQGGMLTHTGTALNSRFAISGNANVTAGSMTVGSLGANGTILNNGRLTVGAGTTVTFTGNVVDMMSNNFSFTNSGTMVFTATGTSMTVSLPAQSTLVGNLVINPVGALDAITFSGPMVVGDITMMGAGDSQFNSVVSVSGDLDDTGTGASNFTQTVTFNGPAGNAQNVTIANRTISMRQFWVQTQGTLVFDGAVACSSAGSGVQAAVRIALPSTLEMRGGSSIDFTTTTGIPIFDVFGTLTSQGAFNNRPTIRGGTLQANWAVLTVQNNASVALNGMLFDRFGPTGSQYALRFASASSISLFDFVSAPDCDATDSVIELNTSNLPPRFVGIELGGNCPFNIDARNALVLNSPVECTPGANSGGPLFGDTFEQDPNNVLNWVVPPALEINSNSPLSPAYAGQLYQPGPLSAAGGTGGYTWSATGMPSWLTLTPGGGQLSGTPTAMDVGRASFSVTLDDGFTQVSKAFELDVFAPGAGPVTIATNSLAPATEGRTYSQLVQGQDGVSPYLWTITGLPSGLTVDTQAGTANGTAEIRGAPDFGTEGPYPVAIRVQDQVGNFDTKTITLQVNRQILVNVGVDLGSGSCSVAGNGQRGLITLLLMLSAAGATLFMLRRRSDA